MSFSRVLQKLLKYFNGTAISTFIALPSRGVLPVSLTLNSNNLESFMVAFGSSL